MSESREPSDAAKKLFAWEAAKARHSFLVSKSTSTWNGHKTHHVDICPDPNKSQWDQSSLLRMNHGAGPWMFHVFLQAGAMTVHVPWNHVQEPDVVRDQPGDLQMRIGPVEICLDDQSFLAAYREAVEWLAGCALCPRPIGEAT